MKHIIAKLAALTLLLASPAFAQEYGSAWTSPGGEFSVTIPAGWQRIAEYEASPFMLVVGPPRETADRENRDLEICSVEARPIHGGPYSQPQINSFMDRMQAELPTELRATVIHGTSAEMHGGVRVITVDIDRRGSDGRPTRQMQRLFAVPTEAGLLHFQIGCGASSSSYGAADYDAMRGFIGSLTLTSGAVQ